MLLVTQLCWKELGQPKLHVMVNGVTKIQLNRRTSFEAAKAAWW